MSLRHQLSLGAAGALALVAASASGAHHGKAEPRIAASLSGQGLEATLRARLTDADDGDPIDGATVQASASMTSPHPMRLAPVTLSQTGAGTYSGRLLFAMPAVWTVRIDVSGADVTTASSTLRTRVSLTAATGTSGEKTLGTTVEDTLSGTDYRTMAVLWIHGLASMSWVLAVLVMAVALATRPPLLAGGVRDRLSRWYRHVGVWLHWALVPVIVLTGIYNTVRVTPFSIAWTPAGFDRLSRIPYGELYETILFAKLLLFGVLLVTGTLLLRRTLRANAPSAQEAPEGAIRMLSSGLGAAGVVYLVTVPLILAAAMALRYVHILSHVAVVLQSSG
jgi:hypothetical protein